MKLQYLTVLFVISANILAAEEVLVERLNHMAITSSHKHEYPTDQFQKQSSQNVKTDEPKGPMQLIFRDELMEKEVNELKLSHQEVILRYIYGDNEVFKEFDKRGCIIVSSNTFHPTGLLSLQLHFCALRDENIMDIYQLSFLKILILDANALTDDSILHISRLTGLEQLSLASNDFRNGVAKLATLPNLVALNLTLNKKLPDRAIAAFLDTNLSTLEIEHTLVTKEMVQRLQEKIKKVIYFSGVNISW